MMPVHRRRLAGLGLLLLIAIALALVAIPVWEIRPFVPQTSAGISLAYACHRLAPWVTVLALMAGAALAAGLWRGAGGGGRALVGPAPGAPGRAALGAR